MNYLSNNILYLRKKNNLKQGDMEVNLGIARATWSNYENGMTEPAFDTLIRIAKFFKVNLNDLILVDLANQPEEADTATEKSFKPSPPRPYAETTLNIEELTFEDNKETTLWYLLREIRTIRKDIEKIKNKIQL